MTATLTNSLEGARTHAGRKQIVAAKAILLSLTFLGAALWPLLVFPDLPLQDFPNHMARAYILLHHNEPGLREHYEISYAPIPDLGWDLWALVFGRYMTLTDAGKLLLAAAVALSALGCAALQRALTGRWSALSLVAFPFLLNGGYTKGFLSFDLGLAVSLWAMAWWSVVPECRWVLRLAIATAFATSLYLIHLYAFGIYGVFVLAYEIQRDHGRRLRDLLAKLARDGLQAVPALGFLVIATTRLQHLDGSIDYGKIGERFGDLRLLIDTGLPWTNGALVLVYIGALALAVQRGWFTIVWRARLVLVVFAVLFLILPTHFYATAYIPWRIVVALLLVGIAAATPTARAPRHAERALLSAALCITAACSLWQSTNWARSERETWDFLAAIAPVPNVSRILVLHDGVRASALSDREPGAYHVGAYAVLAKDALIPSLFAKPGQQVLRFADPSIQTGAESLRATLEDSAKEFSKRGLAISPFVLRFDYLVLHGRNRSLEARVLPLGALHLIHVLGSYRVFRIEHCPPTRIVTAADSNLPAMFPAQHFGEQVHTISCESLGWPVVAARLGLTRRRPTSAGLGARAARPCQPHSTLINPVDE
jgi:hypothetical protein